MKVVLLTLPRAPKVVLLEKLRDTFAGKTLDKRLHVTVRGPFTGYPDQEALASIKTSVEENRLLISGADCFTNESLSVVYLRVQGAWLRQIWSKPDFPVSKFGFNPHITMYEGIDHERARKVLKFLRLASVELIVENFGLVVMTLRQKSLFEEEDTLAPVSSVTGRISMLTLERARTAFGDGIGAEKFHMKPMPRKQNDLAMDFV
jgi:2'-5' RNA ligase